MSTRIEDPATASASARLHNAPPAYITFLMNRGRCGPRIVEGRTGPAHEPCGKTLDNVFYRNTDFNHKKTIFPVEVLLQRSRLIQSARITIQNKTGAAVTQGKTFCNEYDANHKIPS